MSNDPRSFVIGKNTFRWKGEGVNEANLLPRIQHDEVEMNLELVHEPGLGIIMDPDFTVSVWL
jgi:hypothetical protein